MAEVGFDFYRDEYGGALPEAAFADNVARAERNVRWLAGPPPAAGRPGREPWCRAVCAVVDALAEWAEGRAGGISIGSFRDLRRASGGEPAEAVATRAALEELGPAGLVWTGVR